MVFRSRKCRLRQLLSEKKISQTELADKIGMPINQLNDYIHNRKKMAYDTAFNVCRGLGGIPMESLYEWVEWRRDE